MPIPGSYPTNPPALYRKPLSLKVAIPVEANPPVPEPVAQVEEESDDGDVEDGELAEENTTTPWTGSPLVVGQYLPPLTIEEAIAALKDIKLMLRPPWDSGKWYKDPKPDSQVTSGFSTDGTSL